VPFVWLDAERIAKPIPTSYASTMEFTYPINFVGFENGDTSGEVITRDGEFLGNWTCEKDEARDSGAFHFVVDGESEPLFSEGFAFLDSRLKTGLALSAICRSIRDWQEESDLAKASILDHTDALPLHS